MRTVGRNLDRLRNAGMLVRPAFVSAALILFAGTAVLFSQTIKQRSHNVKNGERLYKSGCIACHGATGTGAPETLTEFKRPDTFPDFTRCDQTTPEPNSAWKDIIVNGGPARGFRGHCTGPRQSGQGCRASQEV